jgi:hypothetical protein
MSGTLMIDPRLAFLARASARNFMIEQGIISLDDAFNPLIEPFLQIIGDDLVDAYLWERWERDYRPPPPRQPERRPTPQATIEAVLYSVRERGVAALSDPENVERLARCDQAAKDQINRRIEKRNAA